MRIRVLRRIAALALIGGALSLAPAASRAVGDIDGIRTLKNVRMPTRDGVDLVADIWMPATGGPFPALLERTPYVRSRAPDRNAGIGESWARRGYAFVKQDVRGRGDSEGQYTFLSMDDNDGYDSIEWIARQPWSNRKVGMVGGSYTAVVQWLAARRTPPHLVCMIPRAAPARYFDELPYLGGAVLLEWGVRWISSMSPEPAEDAPRPDLDKVYRHRPLLTLDGALGRPMPLWREFLSHPTFDDYWKRLHFTANDFRHIKVPAFSFTGWFDADQPGAIFYFEQMRRHSPARDQQYLIIGPWTHGGTMRGGSSITGAGIDRGTVKNGVLTQGDMAFSADAVIDDMSMAVAFLEHCLKGKAGAFKAPRARIYVTGSNSWRDFDDYPPPAAVPTRLYLHSAGKANSVTGDGRLDFTAPRVEPQDYFTYDPRNPVPADENNFGKDQRAIQARDDVLVYTTEALEKPVEIIGRVIVELHAASDARDTDFTAKLSDVYPDGTAVKLGPKAIGIIRARFREGYEREKLLTPNKTERFRIELFDIGHTFLPKHRIRLEISSSAYPAVAPNPNTGNPIATDTESRIARQRVHHDLRAASHVLLPVMPPAMADQAAADPQQPAPRTAPIEYLDLGDGTRIELVLVPAGVFTMGSPDSEAKTDEHKGKEPLHKVTITRPFYMSRYEVLQPEYEKVMGTNPSVTTGKRLPVTNVSWEDAIAFARKLSQITKRDVRIPTDAQWEYAARAGTRTAVYAGDDEDAKARVGWCGPGSDKRVHEVGEKPPNGFGLYDMIGNVREWTRDIHGEQDGRDAVDPEGPRTGEMRISRGGAYTGQTLVCRAAIRNVEPATKRTPIIGLRIVVSAR